MSLDARLAKLDSKDADERWRTLEELSDLLEYEELKDPDARRILKKGLDVALREKPGEVREAALHLLATGAARGLASLVSWEPLVKVLPDLVDYQSIEYALIVLGGTREAKYRPAIEKLLLHAREDVRAAAQAALDELGS